jgi:hypothetical protein
MQFESVTAAILTAFLLTVAPVDGIANLVDHSAAKLDVFVPRQEHPSRAEAEKIDVHFTGEVVNGKTFRYAIGRGLIFLLAPPANATDAGWIIEIVPQDEPASGPIEFSSVATPPYHVYNDRVIATLYGRSAREIAQLKDRTFFFVHSVDDEHRAEEVVNAAFYPTDLSDQEKVRIAAERDEVKVSKGELHIVKAHTGSAKNLNDLGAINSIRFEVDIEFAPGLTMADIIARVARPR